MPLKRKGKERKGKGLLYLIVIVAIVSLMAIACKTKPTQVSDFNGIDLDDSVTNATADNPSPSTNPDSTDPDLDQYAGEYKSVEQFRDGGESNPRTFYYKVELKKVDGNNWQLLWKIGDFVNSGVSYGGEYEILRTLKRDRGSNDTGNKKAFSDYATHYVTFDGDELTLMPNRWGVHIVFKKIK